jgi:hypothetical protein
MVIAEKSTPQMRSMVCTKHGRKKDTKICCLQHKVGLGLTAYHTNISLVYLKYLGIIKGLGRTVRGLNPAGQEIFSSPKPSTLVPGPKTSPI